MSYRFKIRVKIWKAHFALFGILLRQLFVADPWVLLITIELPILYGLLWLLTRGNYRTLTFAYCVLLGVRFFQQVYPGPDNIATDQPLFQSPQSIPALASLLESVRREFGCAPYKQLALLISPSPWCALGCSAIELKRRERLAVIPVGCLGIYSVFDLRCELAHALVRRRSSYLIPACERNMRKLEQISRSHSLNRMRNWQTSAIAKLLSNYRVGLAKWEFFANLEADAQVTAKYGEFAVTTWVQRAGLADYCVPECMATSIGPMAEDGVLLPLAATCHAFQQAVESEWLASLTDAMVARQRGSQAETGSIKAAKAEPSRSALPAFTEDRKPGTPADLIVLRLAALQHGSGTAGGHDPRCASSLFDDMPALEEAVIRNEVALTHGATLTRHSVDEIATKILLPSMRQELHRNAGLVAMWKLTDLPRLVTQSGQIAAQYKEDRRCLFAIEQKQALVPRFLTAFFTVGLVDSDWVPDYTGVEEGLTVSRGGSRLQPSAIIDDLLSRKLSETEFLKLCELKEGSDNANHAV